LQLATLPLATLIATAAATSDSNSNKQQQLATATAQITAKSNATKLPETGQRDSECPNHFQDKEKPSQLVTSHAVAP